MQEKQKQPTIEATPTETSKPDAGVKDGTVLPTPPDQPDEKVVYDYDKAGNIVGWHKETV